MKSRKYVFMAVLVTLSLLLLGASAWAQGGQQQTINVQWNDQPLGVALQQLQQAYGIRYSLPGEVANARVTASLQGVTVAQALQELARAANVRMLVDPNSGTYVFQSQQGAGVTNSPPGQINPWATAAGGAMGGIAGPLRPGALGVQPQVGYAGQGGIMPQAGVGVPGTGVVSGLYSGLVGADGQPISSGDLVIRVLKVNYISPELIAVLFGGSAIYDQSGGNSGNSGYGNNNSGYGNSNNNGYNNNNGNSNNGYNNNGYNNNTGYNTNNNMRYGSGY